VSDGELVGGEMLGLQKKTVWQTAWKRFAAVPTRYAGLTDLLCKAKPEADKGDLLASIREESWPQDNEADEQELRQALTGLPDVPVAEARANIIALGKSHKPRRAWVWAKLGQAPLAHAIKHLGALAENTLEPLTGESIDGMIGTYTESGWRADAAMLDSLASVSHHDDRQAICAAIEHIYTPWLRDAAELFQQRFKAQPLPGRSQPRLDEVADGTCVLFADGLRLDVGQKLNNLLKGRVEKVELSHQAVALPSVTPTSKPAVSPVADKINGVTAGEEFRPSVAETEKDLTTDRFRKLLEEAGFQVLSSLDIGNPEGRAWTEYGNLDQTGHKEGIGLASRVQELLRGLAARIESLLAAGWREVRVVTDHGWLLVPGGLPKAELPKYLTATRWGRCAVVKPSATVDLTCFSWFWSDAVQVASPTGIDCFIAGKEYNHGGLSLQECVVPQLTVRGKTQPAPSAKIDEVKWAGLRCRIKVKGQASGCKVDLRDKANDPGATLASATSLSAEGKATILVENDQREGTAAILVLLDQTGTVLEKMPITVGE